MIPRTATILALLLLHSATASAGLVSGTLKRENGAAVGNTPFEIRCGSRHYSGATDSRGAYRVYINYNGKCLLEVRRARFDVFFYERPVRYDLILGKNPRGQAVIFRR